MTLILSSRHVFSFQWWILQFWGIHKNRWGNCSQVHASAWTATPKHHRGGALNSWFCFLTAWETGWRSTVKVWAGLVSPEAFSLPRWLLSGHFVLILLSSMCLLLLTETPVLLAWGSVLMTASLIISVNALSPNTMIHWLRASTYEWWRGGIIQSITPGEVKWRAWNSRYREWEGTGPRSQKFTRNLLGNVPEALSST